jgi:NAD(P)H-hydrate epimerase
LLQKSNAIAVGPGMGDNETTFEVVSSVIKQAKCPVVIDADGINVLKNNLELLKQKNGPILITPHLGEMSRLTGLSIEHIKENRIEVAKKFAKDYGVIVLQKGYNTVITDGDILIINPTGNSSMASGGMGDCLTGMLAAFLGQGYKPMQAACIATYVHGYCGEELSKEMFCVNASHLLEYIPFVIKKLQNR